MKTNTKTKAEPIYTHEGAKAVRINSEQQLRRSVMACMLWEGEFYESGVSIADRISKTIPLVRAEKVRDIAIEARKQMKLRHIPLFIASEMTKHDEHKKYVADVLESVIDRVDELTEYLAIYFKNGRHPVSAQSKKGLARAFHKFDEYQFAKYDRDDEIKLRDALFICHAKPQNEDEEILFKKIVEGTLKTPDTWEVALSGGADKKETFERLMRDNKLGAMALLRNLRNMTQAGVDKNVVYGALERMNVSRVLPFRFITATKYAPKWEEGIEKAFLKCTTTIPKLPGKTVLVVDVSDSMYHGAVSRNSELDRAKAACSLAVIVREVCEDSAIYATAGNDGTRVHDTSEVPARRGFALLDTIYKMCRPLGGGGIFLKQCLDYIKPLEKTADRIIVITDEQDCDTDTNKSPEKADAFGTNNYLINVASYENGIGYQPKWLHIDGWSEHVLDYIRTKEQLEGN